MNPYVKQKVESASENWFFKPLCLLASVFLIVAGSMLVYEAQQSVDTQTNVGLIVVGSIALGLTGALLCFVVYASRMYNQIPWKYIYLMVLVVIFGIVVGTLSIINGVDVPNDSSRNTLGWVFGAICTAMGVLATLVLLYVMIFRDWKAKEKFDAYRNK